MPKLGQSSFSAGWTPSSDARNAPENGLLRMDNVSLDDVGALTSLRGNALASNNFGQAIRNIWSKRIFKGTTKHYRYAHLADGSVFSTSGSVSDLSHSRAILTGGNTFIAAFGNSGEYALICSGNEKKKDDGNKILDLGIEVPTAAPSLVKNANHTIPLFDSFAQLQVIEEEDGKQGTIITAATNYISLRPNVDSGRVILRRDGASNFASFIGGESINPFDKFNFTITGSREANYTYVTVSFLTIPRPNIYNPNEQISTYSYTFIVEGAGITQNFAIERQDFVKQIFAGYPLEWSDIKQVEVAILVSGTSATDEVRINQGHFVTATGNLSGTYKWVQVNGYKHPETNKVSISPVGIETEPIQLNDERVKVTPQQPSGWGVDVNTIWIFRREVTTFDTYYRTAIRNDVSQFEDTATDREIIGRVGPIERIDDDRTIRPTRIDWFIEHPPNNIIGIAGPYFGRTVYLTEDKIYLSRFDDPDSVDSRYTFDVSGNSSERNLWVWQVGDSRLLIGTNVDIYSLAGTMRTFEDGTVDADLRPFGIDSPPISRRVTSYEDNVIYMSKEGWRILNGSSSILITGQTGELYDEKDLYGFSQVLIDTEVSRRYDCTVSRSKLYCIVHHDPNIVNPLGRERTLLVYDFQQKYWHATDLAPTALWTEEHGIVLAAFEDNYYRSLDRPAIYALPSTDIRIRSPFLYGGEPDSRKDLETLKIYGDSNAANCDIYIRVDGADDATFIATIAFSGPQLHTLDLEKFPGINKGKSFSLELVASNLVEEFKLFYWDINYASRPEQRNYLRVPPTNFGVAGRKRFYDLPFSVDMLGGSIEVTPVLDGTSLSPQNFSDPSSLGKQFISIAFPEEAIGHELGIEIRAGGDRVFEFYELIQPRHTELLPDLQKQAHIPYTNLGTPARKRFVRFAIVIDTRGNTLTFTPRVDDVSYSPMQIRTVRKQTVTYYFTENVEGVDIGALIEGGKNFELYDIDLDETVFKKLPTPTKFLYNCTDFNEQARKRVERFTAVLNTKGGRVQFTAITDGIRQAPAVFSGGDIRKTYSQYFGSAINFVNLCYEFESLDDIEFELFDFVRPERLELLPEPVKFFPIPADNLGNDKRKRFMTYAILIDTFGAACTISLYTNETLVDSSTFTTNGKQTQIHYFTSEILGTDIRAELSSPVPFEFWGISYDETISEVLPAPTKYLVIPPSNFGIAAKKRIRTLPFVIHTRGGTVRFTPTVDGTAQPSSDHSTSEKRTVLHYAETDLFGIDYGGTLETIDETPFEFYGFEEPENVQTIPVGKKFDQVRLMEVRRQAWLRSFEIRCIAGGTAINYVIYAGDVQIDSGTITTVADVDEVYKVDLTKSLRGTIFRITFQATEVFHRYHVYVRHSVSGGSTEQTEERF